MIKYIVNKGSYCTSEFPSFFNDYYDKRTMKRKELNVRLKKYTVTSLQTSGSEPSLHSKDII